MDWRSAFLIVGLGAAQGPNISEAKPAPSSSVQARSEVRKQVGKTKPYQVGTASWYGENFEGKPTASGEPYDMYDMTAAHLHASHWKLCASHESSQRQGRRRSRQRSWTGRSGSHHRSVVRCGASPAIPSQRIATRPSGSGESRQQKPALPDGRLQPSPRSATPVKASRLVRMLGSLPNRIRNESPFHRGTDPRERLIVALDVSSAAAAQKIVAAVGDSASDLQGRHAALHGRRSAGGAGSRRLRAARLSGPQVSRHSQHRGHLPYRRPPSSASAC